MGILNERLARIEELHKDIFEDAEHISVQDICNMKPALDQISINAEKDEVDEWAKTTKQVCEIKWWRLLKTQLSLLLTDPTLTLTDKQREKFLDQFNKILKH